MIILETKLSGFTLTATEEKIVAVLLNPDNLGKSITEICQMVDCSRNTYYDMVKKDGFNDYLNRLTMDLLKSKVNDVINATYKYATTNAKCTKDREMILKMAKVFKEEQDINIKTNQINGKPVEEMTDEELDQLIKSKQK